MTDTIRLIHTVKGGCGHLIEVFIPGELSPEALAREMKIVSELTCQDCALRQDCQDDAEMERRAARMEAQQEEEE